MESSWRTNVPLFGEAYNYWQYFARLVTPIPGGYNYLAKLHGFNNQYFVKIQFDELVALSGGALPTPIDRHFPWGYAVDPD